VRFKVLELFKGVYKTWPPGEKPAAKQDNSQHIYTWITGEEAPTTESLVNLDRGICHKVKKMARLHSTVEGDPGEPLKVGLD